MGRPKLYTEEELKQRNREKAAKWNHQHRAEKAEYEAKYRKTKMGRASYLVKGYKAKDEKYNRGECTLIPQWIIDNIFSKPCHYCGETDWLKIGCDRIDNSLPHTHDNVVPCCFECNCKRGSKSYEEFKKEMEGI